MRFNGEIVLCMDEYRVRMIRVMLKNNSKTNFQINFITTSK